MREPPATFADIAVTISIVIERLRLDIVHDTVTAMQIGVSDMAIAIAMGPRELEVRHLEKHLEELKRMSKPDVEPQVRAVLARKATRRWSDFARAAVL